MSCTVRAHTHNNMKRNIHFKSNKFNLEDLSYVSRNYQKLVK